jgi:hypothetical protein
MDENPEEGYDDQDHVVSLITSRLMEMSLVFSHIEEGQDIIVVYIFTHF